MVLTAQKAKRRLAAVTRSGLALFCATVLLSTQASAFDIDVCEQEELHFHIAELCSKAISNQAAAQVEPSRIFTLRGYAWLREDEPIGAVADFSLAIKMDGRNISALKGRARAYSALKRYDEAVRDWTLVVSMQPEGEDHYRARALAYLELGKTKEAFADYDKAIEIKANNPDSYIGRARIYQRMAMRDAALREFDRAAAADPEYPETYFAKAQAAESWGDADMAIQNYALVLRYNGDVWYAQRAMKRLGAKFSDFEARDAAQPKDEP
jgi:tetratricopeptide (TPR) repeat protein